MSDKTQRGVEDRGTGGKSHPQLGSRTSYADVTISKIQKALEKAVIIIENGEEKPTKELIETNNNNHVISERGFVITSNEKKTRFESIKTPPPSTNIEPVDSTEGLPVFPKTSESEHQELSRKLLEAIETNIQLISTLEKEDCKCDIKKSSRFTSEERGVGVLRELDKEEKSKTIRKVLKLEIRKLLNSADKAIASVQHIGGLDDILKDSKQVIDIRKDLTIIVQKSKEFYNAAIQNRDYDLAEQVEDRIIKIRKLVERFITSGGVSSSKKKPKPVIYSKSKRDNEIKRLKIELIKTGLAITHGITPSDISSTLTMLRQLLSKGNPVSALVGPLVDLLEGYYKVIIYQNIGNRRLAFSDELAKLIKPNSGRLPYNIDPRKKSKLLEEEKEKGIKLAKRIWRGTEDHKLLVEAILISADGRTLNGIGGYILTDLMGIHETHELSKFPVTKEISDEITGIKTKIEIKSVLKRLLDVFMGGRKFIR